MPDSPEPDVFGRVRVRDEDTGHKLTVHAAAVSHGNYTVLDEPASHPRTGLVLPPEHAAPKSLSKSVESTNKSGQQADPKKETDHA